MTPSQKFLAKIGLKDEEPQISEEIRDSGNDRRSFLKRSALGGLSLGSMMFTPLGDVLAHSTSRVNRHSAPSDLKITDMRYATIMNTTGRCTIIRIDTNQGISGYGEVRDGADWRYALFLKSRIMGMN